MQHGNGRDLMTYLEKKLLLGSKRLEFEKQFGGIVWRLLNG
jgi:hypothetical protein